jgi:predicted DsbA family dithiol-disulfide isomerase
MPKILPNIRLAQESIYFADRQNMSLVMANALFNAFFNLRIDISDQEEILEIGKKYRFKYQLIESSTR